MHHTLFTPARASRQTALEQHPRIQCIGFARLWLVLFSGLIILCSGATATAATLHFNLQGTAGPGLLPGNEPGAIIGGTGGEIGTGITYDDVTNLLTVSNVGWGSSQGFTDLSSSSNNSHIHGPTASNNGNGFTQTAGVLFTLARSSNAVTGGIFTDAPILLSAAQETDLLNGKYYINIHTVNNGGGELRGFLVPVGATVTSLNIVNTNPTNAATVNWTLAFASAVTGVTASNFSLAGTASSGASVGTPTTANAGLTWNVPVTTGSTSGTLTLSMANATGLSQSITTALPFAGQSYTMDKTAPTVSIVVADTSITFSETSLVTFTFNEAVIGFSNADLTIPNGTLSAVTSGDGGITWTATFTPTAGIVDVTNVITVNKATLTDLAGNPGVGTTSSNNFAVNTIPPAYDLNKAPGSAADAPDVLAYGAVAGDGAGNVVRAGDLNGDGIDDLIIGASNADVGTPLRADAGAVYVWFGQGALAGTKDAAATAGTVPDLTIMGATDGDTLTARLTAGTGGAIAVGDVNGDGTADLILGALNADGPEDGRSNAGEAYVVFGRKSPAVFPATLDLAMQGSSGADVTLYGATASDNLTTARAVLVGDVNGDGTSDIIVGTRLADGPAEGRPSAGEAYIVFGRKSPATFPPTLDLAVQGSTGADVTLYGASGGDLLTNSGMVIGDVNGDGTSDLLLGASQGAGPGEARPSAGEAYIVFGRKSPATFPPTLDLAEPGSIGADVTLYGASGGDLLTSGRALAVGDVNGDGTADVLLGAPTADGDQEGRSLAGEAYIVFGRKSPAVFPATLDLGFGADVTLYGGTAGDSLTSGGALAVGDVNGDGTPDLLLGALSADGPSNARSAAGEAYIVFGRKSPAVFPTTLDLGLQGSTGADVTLYGATAGDNLTSGGALALGDVNGDGTTDMLLGALNADGPADGRADAGEAYIAYGRKSPAVFPATLDLGLQGSTGADITLYGATTFDTLTTGGAVAAGDVNGDGIADLILGASAADGPTEARGAAGEAYVRFGIATAGTTPELSLQLPAGPENELGNGNTRTFGSVNVGNTADLVFTVRNLGSATLILTGTPNPVTVTGTDAAQFSVTAQPAVAVTSLGSTTFTVRFTPVSSGSKSASLSVPCNDSDEGSFTLALTGTGVGLTPLESWRQLYFGSPANSGNGADTFDFDKDGLVNLIEFAFGLNPTLASSAQLPQVQRSGGNFFYSFIEPAGVSGITYGAEWSTTLALGSWTAIPDTGTGSQHIFSVPIESNTRMFLRLTVTSP